MTDAKAKDELKAKAKPNTETIDLTDDDPDNIVVFLAGLRRLTTIMESPHHYAILSMFTKKKCQNLPVMDDFLDWGEANKIDTMMMMHVARILNIKYVEFKQNIVWEEMMPPKA
jgi:hypothetical protein